MKIHKKPNGALISELLHIEHMNSYHKIQTRLSCVHVINTFLTNSLMVVLLLLYISFVVTEDVLLVVVAACSDIPLLQFVIRVGGRYIFVMTLHSHQAISFGNYPDKLCLLNMFIL